MVSCSEVALSTASAASVAPLLYCLQNYVGIQLNDLEITLIDRWFTAVLPITGERSVKSGIQAVAFQTTDAHSFITSGNYQNRIAVVCRFARAVVAASFQPAHCTGE